MHYMSLITRILANMNNINKAAELILGMKNAPGANKGEFLLDQLRKGNPYTPPEGMPDYKPFDRGDNPYTPPPGMPDYSPSGNDDDGGDPNNHPVLPPPPPEFPWDRDLPPDPLVDRWYLIWMAMVLRGVIRQSNEEDFATRLYL